MPRRSAQWLLTPALLLALARVDAAAHEDRLFEGFHSSALHDSPSGDPDGEAALFGDLPVAGAAGASPEFDAPRRLRPCCAFGQGLGVRLVFVPLPGVKLDNVLPPANLGRHRYDSGMLGVRNGIRRVFLSRERNGLVYTRRGGFVDLAHVRTYADWTVYLAHRIAPLLPEGGALELPREGGRRVVQVRAVDPAWLAAHGRKTVAIALARWLSYQLSIWHEAATWYGWSTTPIFPERVSAFSPEDLYSNLLGANLAGAILRADGGQSEAQYEASMDAALPELLRRLGAVSVQCSRRAAASVDGFWWDSRRRLPNADLVRRRSFALGPALVPWRVALPDPGCTAPAGEARPVVLHVEASVGGRPPGELARLSIEVADELAGDFPFRASGDRWVDQDELAIAIAELRRRADGP